MFEALAEHLGGVALETYSAAVAGSDQAPGLKHFWANGAQTSEVHEALRTGRPTHTAGASVAPKL